MVLRKYFIYYTNRLCIHVHVLIRKTDETEGKKKKKLNNGLGVQITKRIWLLDARLCSAKLNDNVIRFFFFTRSAFTKSENETNFTRFKRLSIKKYINLLKISWIAGFFSLWTYPKRLLCSSPSHCWKTCLKYLQI